MTYTHTHSLSLSLSLTHSQSSIRKDLQSHTHTETHNQRSIRKDLQSQGILLSTNALRLLFASGTGSLSL